MLDNKKHKILRRKKYNLESTKKQNSCAEASAEKGDKVIQTLKKTNKTKQAIRLGFHSVGGDQKQLKT